MIDEWAYTNDSSYISTIQQALLAQVGPDSNYMPPAYDASLGNDDQAFWGMAVLTAIEYGFPTPSGNSSSVWLDLAKAVFDSQAARWDTSSCNGGLKWQIFTYNAGYDYKNSISNGAFLQMAARLARYTGNQTYVEWAERTWDWMRSVNLIDADYNVYDGTNDLINCTQVDHDAWTYNPATLLYGTAMLYNFTNGSQIWENRTTGLLGSAANKFFSPYKNATNIMFEPQCEPTNNCNDDQLSFKAYLSRWMAKAAVVAPYITSEVSTLLTASAKAAAQSCSGGTAGTTCGQKWYVGGYDGSFGVGQELCALETIQALLLLQGDNSQYNPQTSANVHIRAGQPSTSTFSVPAKTSATAAAATTSKGSAAGTKVGSTSSTSAIFAWAMVALGPVAVGLMFGNGLVR